MVTAITAKAMIRKKWSLMKKKRKTEAQYSPEINTEGNSIGKFQLDDAKTAKQ